mgnify:CR=1 FL=1
METTYSIQPLLLLLAVIASDEKWGSREAVEAPHSGEALEAPNSGGTMIIVLPSHFLVTSVSLPKDFGVSFQNKKDSIFFTDCT